MPLVRGTEGKPMIPRTQVWLWGILAVMFLAGAAGVTLADQLPWAWLVKLAEEVGRALLIASLLALTVDRVLKLEIARGYVKRATNVPALS
jgi:hypothetical protein